MTANPDLTPCWTLAPSAAMALQQRLAAQVINHDQITPVRYVAGVDVGFEQQGQVTRAAVAVLAFPALTLQAFQIERLPTQMPYIPGLLSFRECPAIMAALAKLTMTPDLILCDGHGQAHPRGLGVASHLGLLMDLPTIGVAKSRLCGVHGDLPQPKGEQVALTWQGNTIGTVLRSRAGVRPLYISSGHKVSLPTAVHYVSACLTRYRLPEPTRWADALASNRGNAIAKAQGILAAAVG